MKDTFYNIENWEYIRYNIVFDKKYFQAFQYGVNIDPIKLYYFLKEKFGEPNIPFKKLYDYIPAPASSFVSENIWGYIFKIENDYIIISGDDKVNFAYYSKEKSNIPLENETKIIYENIQSIICDMSLDKYKDHKYDLYLNYCFLLNNLITECEKMISNNLIEPEDNLLSTDGTESESEIKRLNNISEQFNDWKDNLINNSIALIKLRIFWPIYFESLIDLAFRVKLKKSFYNYEKKIQNIIS